MKIATGLLLCALWTLTTGGAMAAEIRVLSAGAVEPGLRAAAAAFKKQSGHDVNIAFNTAPEIRKRIGGGEAFDVVIAPPAALEEFAGAGKLTVDRVALGRVGLGVAVRPGAAVPDISSSEALKRSVLQADSIVFNRASSGIYFENLLKKMEIYDKVQAKTTRYADGAAVMEHVLKGKGREIGFGPVTEILQHREKGLKLVGSLPPEVQNYTLYVGAVGASARDAAAARAVLAALAGARATAWMAGKGLEPP